MRGQRLFPTETALRDEVAWAREAIKAGENTSTSPRLKKLTHFLYLRRHTWANVLFAPDNSRVWNRLLATPVLHTGGDKHAGPKMVTLRRRLLKEEADALEAGLIPWPAGSPIAPDAPPLTDDAVLAASGRGPLPPGAMISWVVGTRVSDEVIESLTVDDFYGVVRRQIERLEERADRLQADNEQLLHEQKELWAQLEFLEKERDEARAELANAAKPNEELNQALGSIQTLRQQRDEAVDELQRLKERQNGGRRFSFGRKA